LLSAALVLVAGVHALRETAHVLLLPPYVWDALTYHLPRLPEWVQGGALVTFETPTLRTFWPANHELLQLWLVLFPHHDAFVEAAGIPFHVLATGAVYACARGLGARRAHAAVAAAAYACCPAVALQATSTKNDLPVAAAYLFCVAVLLDQRRRRAHGLRHLAWMSLVLALTLGTKPYIVFLATGLAVLAWVWRRSTLPRLRPVLRAARRAGARMPVLAGAAVLSAGLVAGFWYVRNAARFGDPFYPTNLRVFGTLVFEGDRDRGRAQQNTLSASGLARNLWMTFHRKVWDDRGPFTAELAEMAGWGFFVFAFGLPSAVYAAAVSAPFRAVAACFLVSLLALFAWVSPDPWNLRFTLWFPALAALAFALALGHPGGTTPRRLWCGLAAAAITLDLVGSLGGSIQDAGVWRAMASLPLEARSSAALGRHVDYIGRGFDHALRTVPEGAPIGYHTRQDGGIYPLYGADFRRRVVFVPIEPTDDVPAVMDARGVRHLLLTRARPVVQERVDAAVARGALEPLGEGLYERRFP
jgi:hypothetical protein